MNSENNYDDIIGLPHHVSANRSHMAVSDRAAQFSPFAALTGHDAAVQETARLTDRKTELDENIKEIINEKLIASALGLSEICIEYFQPDGRKSGGVYLNTVGFIKKIDTLKSEIVMSDGKRIPVNCIRDVQIIDC